MRFGQTPEQHDFATALDALLGDAGVPAIARAWADRDHVGGLALWGSLAELGVAGLSVAEADGGLAASAADIAVGWERLGYHGFPGPWLETAVLGPALLEAVGDPDGLLPGIALGKEVLAIAAPPLAPYAVDMEAATRSLLLEGGLLHRAEPVEPLESVDPTRHLSRLAGGEVIGEISAAAAAEALDLATLACSAQLLGAGRRMLEDAVGYVRQRHQFGRAIGSYQAVKHLLADVRVALDFAAPLVHGAALAVEEHRTDGGGATTPRAVSAAKVATADAAWLAARTALQVHGAIGYTREYDLSLWLARTRALVGAWGTPDWHRNRVLAGTPGRGVR